MKKKCPLCNKFIEVNGNQNSPVTEFVCPKCNENLLLFSAYTFRVEGSDRIRVKCPSCEKYYLHEISRNYSKRLQSFAHFHQKCPMCESPVVISGLIHNDGQESFFDADIDTYASFSSAHYVIAAASPFLSLETLNFPNVRAAKSELKRLLALPRDELLPKVKRYDDYLAVSKSIRSFLVDSSTQAHAVLPENFKIIYTSGNLLSKREKSGDFLHLLELLVSLVNKVEDICGKAAIVDSVVNDLNSIPSEIPFKWVKSLKGCQSSPGYNMFNALYEKRIFEDFENLNGFCAERHLYNFCDEDDVLKKIKSDSWFQDFGYAHPTKIIQYASEKAVDPDKIVEILKNAGIPIFTLDKQGINWHDYEEQFQTLTLKENALGFPSGKSIRQVLGKGAKVWETTRKMLLEQHNNTCQICGYKAEETRYLHAHEVWDDGPEPNVLLLKDIQLLCNRCHDCNHIGQYLNRNRKNSREAFDMLIAHMAKVNHCSFETIWAYHLYLVDSARLKQLEKIQTRLAQHQHRENTATANQTIQYIINDHVANRVELLAALEEKGLAYHKK